MKEWLLDVPDEAGTDRLGRFLAENLPPGTVCALIGTLGAGKTRLVRAVAEHLGIPPGTVASPTFVLLHEYEGDLPIFHFDAYRLESEAEFNKLGPEEYFDADGLTFLEWADRVPGALPVERIDIVIDVLDGTARRFALRFHGERFERLCEPFREQLAERSDR